MNFADKQPPQFSLTSFVTLLNKFRILTYSVEVLVDGEGHNMAAWWSYQEHTRESFNLMATQNGR